MKLKQFYDEIRTSLSLTNQNVQGFDFLIQEGENRKVPLTSLAYILATAFHETAGTMQPIREYGSAKYLRSKPYYPYVGMGYVQLTWKENYEKASKALGVDFVKSPNLLLDPQYAAPILFIGMEEGWFTGKKLSDYIDGILESDKEDLREYSNSRKIVNGTDKQVLIGTYALVIDRALRKASYSLGGPIPVETSDTTLDPVPARKTGILRLILDLILKLLRK